MASLREQAEGGVPDDGGGGSGTGVAQLSRAQLEQIERRQQLETRMAKMTDAFARAMPGADARQLLQDAATCLRTVKKLDTVDGASLMGSLMTIAQLGLRPGVNGLAWPLPFWDSYARGMRAQTVIGYKGYIHLAYKSGEIRKIIGREVFQADDFKVDYGEDRLHHIPYRGPNKDRGPVTDYYVAWETRLGGRSFFWMQLEDMLAWRDKYAPRGKPPNKNESGPIVGPWANDPGTPEFRAMGLKTCLRRAVPFLPTSTALATAATVDDTVRVDVSPLAEPGSVSEHPEREAIEGTVTNRPETRPAEPGLPPEDQDPTLQPGYGQGGEPT